MSTDLTSLCKQIAEQNGVDANLIQAIAAHESAWNTYAVRYEPDWDYFVDLHNYASSLHITDHTEETLQSMSWGLMQVMGSVAREHGYTGMLTQLVEPDLNLLYGTLHVKGYLEKYGNEQDAISSYNQGLT